MVTIARPNEIYLFGFYYPILSDVQEALATAWPQKIVFGDYTKDSESFVSSLVFADSRGGIGIKDMEEAKDANRCYISTCELGFKGHLVLPALATDCTNPTTNLTDCVILIEYGNTLYACFGPDVWTWNEGTEAWIDTAHTLSSTPTDAIVHKSKLYFACGTDFERFDGTDWTTGLVLSAAAQATRYFLEWDGKLFFLSNAGALRYTTTEGTVLQVNAQSTLEAGMFTSLFSYRDSSGTILPHLGTKVGVYILDFENDTWQETELVFPQHDYACLGATRWRESAYIPVGMGIYQYQASSDPTIVLPMGPDRDYGLPSLYRGNIIKLLNEHNALYALVDATAEEARTLYTGSYVIDGVFYDNQGSSLVMKWDGVGWSITYSSGTADEAVKTAVIATADGVYRLWFAINKTVFYIPLNVNLQNPLEIASYAYAASADHTLPWFDADNAVVDKMALAVTAYAAETADSSVATTCAYIQIYYGTDYDDNTWTLLTNTTFPTDGKIDEDGETRFTFASDAGINFKAIRLKAVLTRGTTATTVSPDLRWLRLEYMKLTEAKYSFSVMVDCTRDYRHNRAGTLLEALKTAADTKTLGDFAFRNVSGATEVKKTRILSMKGATVAGRIQEGVFQVDLLEP